MPWFKKELGTAAVKKIRKIFEDLYEEYCLSATVNDKEAEECDESTATRSVSASSSFMDELLNFQPLPSLSPAAVKNELVRYFDDMEGEGFNPNRDTVLQWWKVVVYIMSSLSLNLMNNLATCCYLPDFKFDRSGLSCGTGNVGFD